MGTHDRIPTSVLLATEAATCTIDIAYIYDTQPYVIQAHYNNY